MARVLDITAATDAVRLDTKGQGDAAFTVSNVSGRRTRGRAKAVPKDPATAGWLKIAGDVERDFPSSGSQLFTVSVAVPSDARPGTYSFRLDVVSVDNPDEETAQGPSVSLTVAEAAPPPPKSHLMWFILALVVLLIAAVGAIWFVLRKPAPAMFAGSWSTNFARLELKQDGANVTGEYRLHGTVDPVKVVGTVDDRTLSGVLGDPATNTTFTLKLDPATHSFNGTWGANKPWCGVSTALASLPEGCSFTGQWTLMFENKPFALALTQVANKVTGTVDMGAPDHRKASVDGELKGWVLEGEMKNLMGEQVPPMPIRWTPVDQKLQQFHGIQYSLTLSDAQPENRRPVRRHLRLPARRFRAHTLQGPIGHRPRIVFARGSSGGGCHDRYRQRTGEIDESRRGFSRDDCREWRNRRAGAARRLRDTAKRSTRSVGPNRQELSRLDRTPILHRPRATHQSIRRRRAGRHSERRALSRRQRALHDRAAR